MSEESVGDAGASNLGYFTGCFSPEGTRIMAHGFTGALHLWKRPGLFPHATKNLKKLTFFGCLKFLKSVTHFVDIFVVLDVLSRSTRKARTD